METKQGNDKMNTLQIQYNGETIPFHVALQTLTHEIVWFPYSRADVLNDLYMIRNITSHDVQRAALQQFIDECDLRNAP